MRGRHNPETRGRMRITVLLFAAARERVGERQVSFELGDVVTVGGLKVELGRRYPALGDLAPVLSVAVNQEYRDDDTVVRSDDEIAVLPPVSGGSGRR